MFRKITYDAGRITLNRPDKRNALDPEMIAELREALDTAAADTSVRVVVIRGAGKDFCSGADLESLERVLRADVVENLADARSLAGLFLAMRDHARPVIAAVRGRALAGGCGLATACDIVLAADSAQFGYPEVNIGFVPAMVMAMLRRSVSEKEAFQLVATGEVIGAKRACEMGLVQRVFADEAFDSEVEAYVNRLAAKPPSAVSMTKGLLYHMDGQPFETALESGVHTNTLARMTEDCKAGIRRFLSKAQPG